MYTKKPELGACLQKFEPWLNGVATFDTTAATAKYTQYSYTSNDDDDEVDANDARPRCVVERVGSVELKRTYHTYIADDGDDQPMVEIVQECTAPGAAYDASGNHVTTKTHYKTTNSDVDLAGKLKSVEYPDGRMDLYTYDSVASYSLESGDSVSDAMWEAVTHYGVNASGNAVLVENKTTRDIKIYDQYGNLVAEETAVCTDDSGSGTFEVVEWKQNTYDGNHMNLVVVEYSDGTGEHNEWGTGCCGKDSYRDRQGIVTSYGYDDYGRIESEIQKGVADGSDLLKSYSFDAKGRTLSSKTVSGDEAQSLCLTSRKTYDWTGRVKILTDEQGLTTTTTYNDTYRKTTTTYPGNGTRIVEKYKDGRVKSITGTAVVHETYDYGVNSDGTHWAMKYTGPDGTSSARWEKTT